ncbi:hypothetical protein BC832DRAFT_538884 [Gaertneriomyces semiglobifer]|nr:hypothetical protein BC832DRAFT_538884 [Gaertneriomyces semiglobifer]
MPAVFIINQKLLPEELSTMQKFLHKKGGKVVEQLMDAEIVLTKLSSPARISKHLGHEIRVPVISVEWIKKCMELGYLVPYDPYTINVSEYIRPTSKNDGRQILKRQPSVSEIIVVQSDSSDNDEPRVKRARVKPARAFNTHSNRKTWTSSSSSDPQDSSNSSYDSPSSSDDTEDENAPYDADIPLDPNYNNTPFECCRKHPLRHWNEKLVEELKVVERKREVMGEKRSALSYRRAIAAIISYPREITSWREARKIKSVGDKIAHMVKEFLKTGKIREAESIRSDISFHLLNEFASVYGVGPHTARDWYNAGHRSIQDVLDSAPHLTKTQRIGLDLYPDFSQKMTRADVEEVVGVVKLALEVVEPGCVVEIVGGYRRGKDVNGDCDVVITHPTRHAGKELLAKLVDLLKEQGHIKHILWYGEGSDSAQPSDHTPTHSSFDKLAKAFVAFLQPSTQIHRQLDLIISPYDVFAPAVLGWSGSKQFERGLRDWCKRGVKGWHFASHGLFDRRTMRRVDVKSEREIFDRVGLEWVEPTDRNA